MKKLLLSITFLSGIISLHAQFSYQYLDAANGFYAKGDYSSASSYYEKYLSAGKKSAEGNRFEPYSAESLALKKREGGDKYMSAVYRLAESYRLLTYYVKAAPYYKEAADAGSSSYPLALFHYGEVLKKQEQYKDAAHYLHLFLDSYKDSTGSQYVTKAKQELASLEFIEVQQQRSDAQQYQVSAAPQVVNTEGASYAAAWLDATTLLFTSTRTNPEAAKNSQHYNHIYEAVYQGAAPVSVNKIALPQPADQHQGVISVSADGQRMYLTRWTAKSAKEKSAAIYLSQRNGSAWGEPVPLTAMVNSTGNNNQQPSVSADGQWLFFASNRPGGQGGYDIWCAQLDASGQPVKVENMGNTVNTSGDEQAPYFHEATTTLFFASNGRIGMGGYDIYSSKKQSGLWAAPVNIGAPYNSAKDDMYFTVARNNQSWQSEVLLSSDRSSACCLELFTIRKTPSVQPITGIVKDCNSGAPLSGITVDIWDSAHQQKLYSITTANDGSYHFTPTAAQALQAVAVSPKYQQGILLFHGEANWDSSASHNPDLCLTIVPPPAPKEGEVKLLDHVFYALNKAQILDESKPALDELVQLLVDNPGMEIEISGHTDNTGSNVLNQKLSQQRADNVVAYLISKGIAASRLKATGYGDSKPVAPNTNEDGSDNSEGRQKNRRTEFKVLHQ